MHCQTLSLKQVFQVKVPFDRATLTLSFPSDSFNQSDASYLPASAAQSSLQIAEQKVGNRLTVQIPYKFFHTNLPQPKRSGHWRNGTGRRLVNRHSEPGRKIGKNTKNKDGDNHTWASISISL